MTCFISLPEFKKWFDENGYRYAQNLKIITCGTRETDGGKKAAENVVVLTETDARLKGAPVLVYCGTTLTFLASFSLLKTCLGPGSVVALQYLAKRGAIVSDKSAQFMEFCLKY